jgi:S1-C subfamily serine protease
LGGIVGARSTPEGRYVYEMAGAGSRAARAGIRVGDVILSVDGVPIHQVPLMNLFGKNWIGGTFPGRAGEPVVLKILRDGKEQDIPVTLGAREETNFRIENDPAATTEQLSVRSAWLKR